MIRVFRSGTMYLANSDVNLVMVTNWLLNARPNRATKLHNQLNGSILWVPYGWGLSGNMELKNMTVLSPKSLAFGIAAVAAFAAVPASAVTTILGPINPNGSTPYGRSGITPTQNFDDSFIFTVPFARKVTVTVFSQMLNPFKDNINFINPQGAQLNGNNFDILSTGVIESRTITMLIGAGDHTIRLRGSAGSELSEYSGLISLGGVPEPTSWALMILGFGVIGAAMRRRRAQVRTAVSYS